MRSRSISFYSEEDFHRQQKRSRRSNSDLPVISSTQNQPICQKKTEEINIDNIDEDELYNYINSLNDNYKKNISLNDHSNTRTQILIAKCFKELIKNKESIFFNKRDRINSFDVGDKKIKVNFRHLIDFLKEKSVSSILNDNLTSLSFVNLLLITNFKETFELNFKFDSKESNFIYQKSTQELTIFTKHIFLNKKRLTLKIFDIDLNLELFPIYLNLCQVLLVIINGKEKKLSIEFLKKFKVFSQPIIVIEVNSTDNSLENYCRENKFLWIKNRSPTNIDISEKLLCEMTLEQNNILKKNDIFVDNTGVNLNKEDDNDEVEYDHLKRGIEYKIHSVSSESAYSKIFPNKKMSHDDFPGKV